MTKKEMARQISTLSAEVETLKKDQAANRYAMKELARELGYFLNFTPEFETIRLTMEGEVKMRFATKPYTPCQIVKLGGTEIVNLDDELPDMVDTERVKNVTLEELARFVIDGKPIARHEIAVVEYAPECHIAERNSENEKDTNTI